jgi:hypothetical protein
MKLFRFASTAVLCASMAAVLAAQTPTPQSPPKPVPAPAPVPAPMPEQPAAQPRDAADVTITGCLAQDTTDPTKYTLTVAPPASATGDAARVSNSSTKPATYKITGLAADQLKAHVSHQVELKGNIKAATSAASREAVDAAPEFSANAVKMISATCPPAK